MRKVLEKVLFYLFYGATAIGVVSCFHPAMCMCTCLVIDVVFIVYAWVRFSDNARIHSLRKVVYAILLLTMVCGALFCHTIVPFIYLGPVFLGYLRLEGGYRHVKVS